jgi:hypothetical protein
MADAPRLCEPQQRSSFELQSALIQNSDRANVLVSANPWAFSAGTDLLQLDREIGYPSNTDLGVCAKWQDDYEERGQTFAKQLMILQGGANNSP